MPVPVYPIDNALIARVTVPDTNLFGSFGTGQEWAQKQAERNLFSQGLPRDQYGNVDWNQVAEKLARLQGAGAIGSLGGLRQADIQQQFLGGLGQNAPSVFTSPQAVPSLPSPAPPSPAPVSLDRSTTSVEEPAVATNRLRPDQPGNLTGPGTTITGVEYGPATSFAPDKPAQPGPAYPPQFQQVPDTGPATDRFRPVSQIPGATSMAQAPAQAPRPAPPPAPAQSPVPPGAPGFFTEQNARAYEAIANRANYLATGAGGAGMAAAVPGLRQQGEQAAAVAKQIREHISKISEEREKARLHEQRVFPEAAAKQSIEQLAESRKEANNFAKGVPATQDMLDQINSKSGIFSGKWASERLALAKIGQIFGVPDDRVMPTEAYRALVGRRVATTVKNFGSGTSITNQDREYAELMEGGNIALDEDSIRRILTLSDQVARDNITNHNQAVADLQREYPDAKLSPYKVKEPPPLKGRTTEPRQGPAGAIPPAPRNPAEWEVGKVYQTPKGNLKYLGNDRWGPP